MLSRLVLGLEDSMYKIKNFINTHISFDADLRFLGNVSTKMYITIQIVALSFKKHRLKNIILRSKIT